MSTFLFDLVCGRVILIHTKDEWITGGFMKRTAGIIIYLALLFPVFAIASENPVAIIKASAGSGNIIRDGSTLEAKRGAELFQHDSLKTGADGSISIVFKDDTLISVGPNSELAINEFLYSPAEGKLSFITRLLKGTSAYVSGIIGKLSPQSVRFETPVANIGIRGTKFAVKLEDN
jgi:hypothetical protein